MLWACSVDRAGLRVPDVGPGLDGGALDLGRVDLGAVDLAMRDLGVSDPDLGPEVLDLGPELVDLGPPDLGPVDMGPPDLGPPDLGPPDLGPPDMGPPDLGPPDLGIARPTCDSLYDAAGSYRLCAERAAECEFYTVLGDTSCDARCTAFGGTCIAVHNNGWTQCERGGDFTCGGSYYDAICICSR